jgi:hypothetical protein
MKTASFVSICALGLVSIAGSAQAVVVDLTSALGNSGTINGGIYTNTGVQAAGSGVLDSFVRVSSNNGYVRGYNTSARGVAYDENTSPTFTHDLALSAVPVVNIGGVNYREFVLDINQQGSAPLETLSNVQIRTGAASGSGAAPAWGSTVGNLIYQMNPGTWDGTGSNPYTNRVELNYNLNPGSGAADMFLYVPDSLFTGASFVYLYSEFGAPNPNNDGYEEWAVRTPGPAVPLPTAAWAGLSCLAGVGALGAIRRRRMA